MAPKTRRSRTPAAPKSAKLRSRIVGHDEVSPTELIANPKNWRVHPEAQKEALTGLLKDVGWVQSVVVNKRTGFVVDGHARVAIALDRKEPTIPVTYVDLSDVEEALVLASLDPLAAMAGTDKQKLDDLLGKLKTNSQALDKVLRGMGTTKGDDGTGTRRTRLPTARVNYSIVFDDEDQLQKFYDFLKVIKNRYPDSPSIATRIMAFIAASNEVAKDTASSRKRRSAP